MSDIYNSVKEKTATSIQERMHDRSNKEDVVTRAANIMVQYEARSSMREWYNEERERAIPERNGAR